MLLLLLLYGVHAFIMYGNRVVVEYVVLLGLLVRHSLWSRTTTTTKERLFTKRRRRELSFFARQKRNTNKQQKPKPELDVFGRAGAQQRTMTGGRLCREKDHSFYPLLPCGESRNSSRRTNYCREKRNILSTYYTYLPLKEE